MTTAVLAITDSAEDEDGNKFLAAETRIDDQTPGTLPLIIIEYIGANWERIVSEAKRAAAGPDSDEPEGGTPATGLLTAPGLSLVNSSGTGLLHA